MWCVLTPLLDSQLQQMYASCKKKNMWDFAVTPRHVSFYLLFSLLILPSAPSLAFIPPRAARGRGCQSSCAPHLERSASTAKEPWVSVYLHGNAHDSPSPSVAQNTSVESSPPLVASRSCQEIFTAGGSIKPRFTHGCQKNESLWKHHVSQVHTPARLISLLDLNLEPHLMDTFYIQMRLNSFYKDFQISLKGNGNQSLCKYFKYYWSFKPRNVIVFYQNTLPPESSPFYACVCLWSYCWRAIEPFWIVTVQHDGEAQTDKIDCS